MNEKILQALHDRHRPGDKYAINIVYNFTHAKELKSFKDDYALALIEFGRAVADFDTHYRGHVVLFKNKVEKEIIRVNL